MKKLAICGKTIDMSKVADKTAAQFRDQLKRNGVTLSDEQFDALWENIQKSIKKEAERNAAAAAKEEGE